MADSIQLACVYATLILADDGVEVTADKILKITEAAGVEVEPIWASIFAKALEGRDIKEMLTNVGGGAAPVAVAAAPAAGAAASAAPAKEEKKKEEVKEESDEDMGFGLFD